MQLRSPAGAVLRAAHAHIGLSRARRKRAKCWWSAESKAAVLRRRAARKRAERTRDRADISAWRKAERECKKTVRGAKAEAWREAYKGNGNNDDNDDFRARADDEQSKTSCVLWDAVVVTK